MHYEEQQTADYRAEQAAFWNGEMGALWVEQQTFIHSMLRPIEDYLVSLVAAYSPSAVLDVGCGNGQTTRSISQAIAPDGQCTGIDLSEPMIGNAISTVPGTEDRVRFICADAAGYTFEPGEFDVICSRFGVMFFADPAAAFCNLRQAAKDKAQLCLVVWRIPESGDFMTAGQRAVTSMLPASAPSDPKAPGPFSFGDPAIVTPYLNEGGWSDIRFDALDLACAFPASKLSMFIEDFAPTGVDFAELSESQAKGVKQVIRAAYEPFVFGEQVRFSAPCWVISGRATAAAGKAES